MVGSKHTFWLALVFTIAVFIIGLSFGFFLEGSRSSGVETNLMNSEINLLDEQVRNSVIENLNINCSTAINSTFSFADDIYSEAQTLENYDSASNFANNYNIMHRRYDMLRTMLWIEAINLRKRCNASFHTVLYLYNYKSEDINEKSTQVVFSKVLEDLKGKKGGEILLVPIAANLNIKSVNLITEKFNVTKYPTIVIDETKKIDSLDELNTIENIVFGGK